MSVAGGHVTYEIEGRLWRSKYPYPGGLQNHVSAGGERREGGRDPKVRLQVLEDEGIDAGCHVISHVFEQMTGMLVTTLAGIFERFPNLRIGFPEAGCGWAPMNCDAARNYGDFFNTYQFTGLFESMARRELRRDPTILD